MICAAIFSEIEAVRAAGHRRTSAAAAILIVLAAAGLLGAKLLGVFGVSLDVFQVAGGVVLAWMGFSMLRGAESQTAPS